MDGWRMDPLVLGAVDGGLYRAGRADRRHIAMTDIAEFHVASSLASSASV